MVAKVAQPDPARSAHYDSSYFHENYSGKRILVLAPHQDDELNIAACAIQNLVRAGAEVFAAFSTNGDYEFTAETRLTEAVNALRVLGVDKSHVLIMGYGDTSNESEVRHMFFAPYDQTTASPSGRTETYGAAGLQDFAYTLRHEHSSYSRKNYLHDLEQLILFVHADIIFTVDFDRHQDHRMLSLYFERAMGRILSWPDNNYRPQVFKRFAYSTAFTAEYDFFADNLLQTQKPIVLKGVDKAIIDTSCYAWSGRVRLPVPEGSRVPLLEENTTADAFRQHVSQMAIYQSEGVLNSDEVFFARRTDSLTFKAQVSSSSGCPDYAHDFMLVNAKDIDLEAPEWTDYLWSPEAGDTEAALTFTWPEEQSIARIVLWGNVDGKPIQKALLSIDNGYSLELEAFPEHGLPRVIDVPAQFQKGIRELKISILDSGGPDGGLAEVEAFEEAEQPGVMKPFVQITSGDNFVYEYVRSSEEPSLPVELYAYRVNEPVTWTVSGNAELKDGRLVFGDDGDVVLRAEAGDGVYCQSVFKFVSTEELEAFRKKQSKEKKKLRREGFVFTNKNRIKKYTQMFRDKGILKTIRRFAFKVAVKIRKARLRSKS